MNYNEGFQLSSYTSNHISDLGIAHCDCLCKVVN